MHQKMVAVPPKVKYMKNFEIHIHCFDTLAVCETCAWWGTKWEMLKP